MKTEVLNSESVNRNKIIKKTMPVLQMGCASCAVKVESRLKSQRGVVDASVNYASASVIIEFLPSLTTADELRQSVQAIGYDLVVDESDDESDQREEIEKKKTRELTFRTAGAAILSVPVVMTGMFFMNFPYANYIMWVLSTPVVLWFGKDFFIRAWKQASHRSANMDTLVALSTGVAYLFSVFNTLFPHFWHQRGLHGHVYFEAAAVIVSFILLGKLLEERAKGKTSSAIKQLMGLQPKTVTVIDNAGNHSDISVRDVRVGNTILVKPGEMIAVDGMVQAGESFVDESAMTGEPVPVLKKEGEHVLSGTINQKGSFQFIASRVGNETMLAQIIRTVQDAQGSKAPVQKLVDKIAGIFVPAVLVIALIAFVLWWLLGGANGITYGLLALVTVLVIACPCALGLATPTAIMVGIGKGAEKGILIRDAEGLELVKKVDAIVLDKTGTITEGKPNVTDISWLNDDSSKESILFSMEKQSEHPVAEAVVNHFAHLALTPVQQFLSLTGKGVKAIVAGEHYLAGNISLLRENNISVDEDLLFKAGQWENDAKTVIWFSDSKKALAVLSIADRIKETSVQAIDQLKKSGIEVYMLTGDNETTARAVARQSGITNYKAGLLPQQKSDFIKELQAAGKTVAMVGDGINDSTALATADVSIAMGQGSDIAMDVAKMTILSSDLNKIPEAIKLSKQTVTVIRQNLFWAFIYNVIGIPVAAGVLFPFTGFLLNPMIAGAAMALSSVSVVSNSLRLKLIK